MNLANEIFHKMKGKIKSTFIQKIYQKKKKTSLLQKMGKEMLSHKNRGDKDKKKLKNAQLDTYKDAGCKNIQKIV